MRTVDTLFCSGHAADCSTMVENPMGRVTLLRNSCSWNSAMASVLSLMSTTIHWSLAVYSYPQACCMD